MEYALSNLRGICSSVADISYGGGSNQAARVKGNIVDWDDWGE